MGKEQLQFASARTHLKTCTCARALADAHLHTACLRARTCTLVLAHAHLHTCTSARIFMYADELHTLNPCAHLHMLTRTRVFAHAHLNTSFYTFALAHAQLYRRACERAFPYIPRAHLYTQTESVDSVRTFAHAQTCTRALPHADRHMHTERRCTRVPTHFHLHTRTSLNS